MKLISYQGKNIRGGIWYEGRIYDLEQGAAALNLTLPSTILELLALEDHGMQRARKVFNAVVNGKIDPITDDVSILAPIPNPPSCRDAYAFRQHVGTSRRNRGLDMIPEFDQFPVFYFTNHRAIFGQGNIPLERDHFDRLDFELEIAAVIGKRGKNIPVEKADSYIAGFTIMNDLSARGLQMQEMKLNLGPAKGKDFATAIGPYLVTPDELEVSRIKTPNGLTYDLPMKAFHNGKQVSSGNMKDMTWTFAQILERVSYGAEVYPGDVIGSGTVGTGCFLELNGTGAKEAEKNKKSFTPTWLQDSDLIELHVECLGELKNRVFLLPNSRSLPTYD